jgi:phosphoglycolate phosphatase-like HAD superfamily hydrolase
LAKLISFDIDGTLEVGDPPGVIPMTEVRRAKGLGHLVGSCSDRTVGTQQRMWADHGISADFTVLKHNLGLLKQQFSADEYYHVGDTDTDRYYALQAGFLFVAPEDVLPI